MNGIVDLSAGPQQPSLIFLTGFMASGKSTVGFALAEALQKDFFDLDREIEARLNKPSLKFFKMKARHSSVKSKAKY